MSEHVVWLFGRGLSLHCGLDWDEPSELRLQPREVRIARIRKDLGAATDGLVSRNGTPVLDRFLRRLEERTPPGCRHTFVTTNWDDLLERAIEAGWPREVPACMRETHVFHINGTIEPGDGRPFRTEIVLPEDPPAARKPASEANQAFNTLTGGRRVLVVGMSFECRPDRFLLRCLNQIQDDVPVGESSWMILNADASGLERVRGLIQECLPGAAIRTRGFSFSQWLDTGIPEVFDPL